MAAGKTAISHRCEEERHQKGLKPQQSKIRTSHRNNKGILDSSLTHTHTHTHTRLQYSNFVLLFPLQEE